MYLLPYANASGSLSLIYQEVSLALETAIALGVKYAPKIGKFMLNKALHFMAKRGIPVIGTTLMIKNMAEFSQAGITYASMMKLVENMGLNPLMLYELRPQSNW